MAAPNTTVKYFHSGMSGAPALSGSAGALITVLDACLVNGFGSITLDSIVVAGGIATATRSAGQSFEKDVVVLVAGSTPAGLNGEKRLLSISGTQFTFDATGISDQTATGTITVKLAPAGWEKQHSGTNLAAYRSLDVASSRAVLRVDDTAAQVARVVGYESMIDASTGTNPFPTTAQMSGGAYWSKSQTASATARNWIVIADGRAVYFLPAIGGAGAESCASYYFGDCIPFKPADAYTACLIGEPAASPTTANPGQLQGNVFYPTLVGCWAQRDYTGTITSLAAAQKPMGYGLQNVASGSSVFTTYPSPIHGSVVGGGMVVSEGAALQGDWRHTLPGAQYLFSSFSTGAFSSKTKFAAEGALAGKVLYCLEHGTAPTSRSMIDISGPWR